jgi:hypothetical protein
LIPRRVQGSTEIQGPRNTGCMSQAATQSQGENQATRGRNGQSAQGGQAPHSQDTIEGLGSGLQTCIQQEALRTSTHMRSSTLGVTHTGQVQISHRAHHHHRIRRGVGVGVGVGGGGGGWTEASTLTAQAPTTPLVHGPPPPQRKAPPLHEDAFALFDGAATNWARCDAVGIRREQGAKAAGVQTRSTTRSCTAIREATYLPKAAIRSKEPTLSGKSQHTSGVKYLFGDTGDRNWEHSKHNGTCRHGRNRTSRVLVRHTAHSMFNGRLCRENVSVPVGFKRVKNGSGLGYEVCVGCVWKGFRQRG